MPPGGVTNHIGVERKSSLFIGHTLYSASPHHPFPILPPLSPFLSFPISSSLPFHTIHLTFFSSNALTAKLHFFKCHPSEEEHFLPFSCVVAVNNRKKQKCFCLKIHQGFGSPALLLYYYRTGNGWLLPNTEARICISASMVTPMVLSKTVRVYMRASEVRAVWYLSQRGLVLRAVGLTHTQAGA